MNDELIALPSAEAIELLSGPLSSGKFAYVMLGANEANDAALDELLKAEELASWEQLEPYAKFIRPAQAVTAEGTEGGGVIYECEIAVAQSFNFYTYAIAMVKLKDPNAQLADEGIAYPRGTKLSVLSVVPIAKTAFIRGIGGVFKFKIAVLSKKAQVIFQNESNYMTLTQGEIFMASTCAPAIKMLASHVELANTLIKKGVI